MREQRLSVVHIIIGLISVWYFRVVVKADPTILVSIFPLDDDDENENDKIEEAVYFHCYHSLETHDRDRVARQCCDAMNRAANALHVVVDEKACIRYITEFPSNTLENDDQTTSLSYAWIHTPTRTVSTGGWFPPGAKLHSSLKQRFLWYDNDRKLDTLPTSRTQPIPQMKGENATGNDNWRALWGTIDDQQAAGTCLRSSVSGTGMHRDWHIDVQLPTNTFDASLLIHLPADVFVNIEDALVCGHDCTCQILSVHPIDQEEPTTASQPHALMVHAKDKKSTFKIIIKLHLRYPPPDPNDFLRIVLPPPLIFINSQTVLLSSSCAGHLLTMWVATGHPDDYIPVLVMTLFVAVMGAVIMLRDVSRVSKWL